MPEKASCRAGDRVPASGLYEVYHIDHSLERTVALFKGEVFPGCSQCDSEVLFAMRRSMPGLDSIRDLQARVSLTALHPVK